MDEKMSSAVNNICTILGGALLLFPLIDQATKTLAPEIQKLTSGEQAGEIKALLTKTEEKQESTPAEKPEAPKPAEKPEDDHQGDAGEYYEC